MSLKHKIPILILASLLINILFVGLYYRFTLSENISAQYSKNTQELELKTKDIAKQVEGIIDYKPLLNEIATKEGFLIEVKNIENETIYKTGKTDGLNLNLSTVNVFRHNDVIYLIKVTNPLSLAYAPSFKFVYELFIAEFMIISITLILLTVVIHLKHVKPILQLQKNIQQYKNGIKPLKTKRKDEIGLLQNEFVDLTYTLDDEKQMQYRIVASISHDIKTPLTSVMGYAEQLQKENISKERFERYIKTLYSKSQVIKELIDEFDDYVSLQLQPGLKKQKIAIKNICKMLEENYSEDLTSIQASFCINVAVEDREIDVDISKLNRVFGNIISNSTKYAKDKNLEINIDLSIKDDMVLFQVKDNGIGVNDMDLSKIFEPFYTSDQSRRVAGLGLSICKSLVESHEGQIWAENNDGDGLTICFLLPMVTG
jgi:signal transduction histidine kinase